MHSFIKARRVAIIPDLVAASRRELLKQLVGLACRDQPGICQEEVYNTLEQREELGSTGIGDGVAVPHCKVPGLSEMLIVCGRCVNGLAYAARDNRPVHLFFLVLSPPQEHKSYLELLGDISRFLDDHQTVARLMQAENAEEMAAVMGTEDRYIS